jgi:hypothetical protein
MEGLISNPGASRWIVSSPGPGLVKHQVRSQKRQQLLQEAASMTPDSAALMQQLGLNDLNAADGNLYGSQLNSSLNEYMTNYRENPYYAFSREGIQKVRDMQTLVHDPRINAVKQAFKSTQESYKKKSEEGLGGYNIVKNGNLVIVDKETGNLREISPDSLDADKHAVPTYEEAFEYLTNKRGFFDQKIENIRPLDNHMANPDEVIEQINKWFQGIGLTQQEHYKNALGELADASLKTTSNTSQIRSKLNAILSSTGLPQNYRDTIYAQYYTDALRNGQKPTRAGAENALHQMIGQIAQGHNVFKEDMQANPMHTGAAAKKDALVETSPWIAAASGSQAPSIPIPFTDSKAGRFGMPTYRPIPTFYLDKSRPGAVFKDDNGITQPKRNVKDSELFSVAPIQNAKILNLYTGQLESLPPEMMDILGEMVLDNSRLGDTGIKYDGNGKAYLHGTHNEVPDTNSQSAFMVDVSLAGERGRLFESERYSKVFDFLSSIGYSAKPGSGPKYTEYKNHINNPDFENIGPLRKGITFYDFKLFTPYDLDAMKKLDNIPVAYEGKSRTTLNFTEAMPSSNNTATQDPRKGNPFSTFGDL